MEDSSKNLDHSTEIFSHLEKLNKQSERNLCLNQQLINEEMRLNEMSQEFTKSTEEMKKSLGGCIFVTRYYYETREKLKLLEKKLPNIKVVCKDTLASLLEAKEVLRLTEGNFFKNSTSVDPVANMNTMNQCINKVSVLQNALDNANRELQVTQSEYQNLREELKTLKRQNFFGILKARPFYDMQEKHAHDIKEQRLKLTGISEQLEDSRLLYQTALEDLENLSLSIQDNGKPTPSIQIIENEIINDH